MSERAAQRRSVRREQLLDAARELMTEKGIANVKVSDITECAGAAKGTFYLYFNSKADVVTALWDRFVGDFVKKTNTLIASHEDLSWKQLARVVIEALIDYDLEHQDLHRLMAESARTDALGEFWDADQQVIEQLADGIRAGVAAGEFNVSDPDLAAAFVYHGTDGILLGAALKSEQVERDRLVEGITQYVYRTLGVTDGDCP